MLSLPEKERQLFYLGLIDLLIRYLAERNSQAAIARTLNAGGLFRLNGRRWGAWDISRYFKANQIEPAFQWRGAYKNNKRRCESHEGLSGS